MKKRKQRAPQRLWRTTFIALITILVFIPVVSSFAESDRYVYDDLNRLIRVEYENGATIEYSYDEVGNRVQKQVNIPQRQITATAGSGGSISPSGTVNVDQGSTASFTITPITGYHIASVTGCGGTLAGHTYTTGAIITDCMVSAAFAADTVTSYTVTPSAGAGGNINPSAPQTVNAGTTTTFTVAPDSGFRIVSASGCGGTLSGNIYTTGPITANCTISAAFAADTVTYMISPSAGTGGSISPATLQMVNAGSTVTFTITPDSGYLVASVLVDGASVGAVGSYNFSYIAADHTISAAFSIVTNYLARIAGATPRYFTTLQAAYTAAAAGETIQAKAETFIENINISRNISVTLEGGYDSDFTSNAGGTTTLKGQLQTWSNGGTLTIKNFVLSQ